MKIFTGLMLVVAIIFAILLVVAYKKNKSAINLMIVSVCVAILFCWSVYKVRTQEWKVEDVAFSTVTDENHIKIASYKAKREWLFFYEDGQVKKIVVPAGTPEEYYEKYLEN